MLIVAILIGLGISELSVVANEVRSLATRVRLLRYDDCKSLVDRVLESSSSAEEVKRQISFKVQWANTLRVK